MSRLPIFVLLFAVLIFSAANPASAASRSAAVQQAVADMKVSETEMKGMRYSRMSNGKSRAHAGMWIPLEDCNGSLVVYLDRYNHVTGMRTTGDCSMDDLKGPGPNSATAGRQSN